jgi:hypothetical protein
MDTRVNGVLAAAYDFEPEGAVNSVTTMVVVHDRDRGRVVRALRGRGIAVELDFSVPGEDCGGGGGVKGRCADRDRLRMLFGTLALL